MCRRAGTAVEEMGTVGRRRRIRRGIHIPLVALIGLAVAGALGGLLGGPTAALSAGIAAAASLLTITAGRRRLGPTLAAVSHPILDPLLGLGVATVVLLLGAGTRAVGTASAEATDVLTIAAALCLVHAGTGLVRERVRDQALELAREAVFAGAVVGAVVWVALVEGAWLQHRFTTVDGILSVVSLGIATAAAVLALRLVTTVPGPVRWFAAAPLVLVVTAVLDLLSRHEAAPAGVEQATLAVAVAACALTGAAVAHPGLTPLRTAIQVPPPRVGSLRLLTVFGTVLLIPAITVVRLLNHETISVPSLVGAMAVLSLAAVSYLGGLARDWAQLERRAQHDELTGLPNRRHFTERLAVAIATADADGTSPAVLFADLDRFKVVNDSLGHAAGNELLVAVARRLADTAPETGVAARISGDEFAILLVDADEEQAVQVAADVIARLGEAVEVFGRSIHVEASIGVARYPVDGGDPDALMRAADTAMYRAKELGRACVVVHTDALRDAVEDRFALETDLYAAVEGHQLRLVYQPRVDLASGDIVGAEALLRWDHPRLGAVPPSRFVAIAEETGLIRRLGRFALREACAQIAAWEQAGYPKMFVSVNMSARQFATESVPDTVASVLRETGADPTWLELELTESIAQHDVEQVSRTISELVDMGVRCSIDDFGTGYSGLSYLGRFPLHALKIDRGFVESIDASVGSRGGANPSTVVAAVIALARSFGLRVIGEGVETLEQLAFLVDNGCDEIQGFLFSPPLDVQAFESLLMLEKVASGPGRLEALLTAIGDGGDGQARPPATIIDLAGRRLRLLG
jgi:diguanylate cyclase (GGDEF)-like protein